MDFFSYLKKNSDAFQIKLLFAYSLVGLLNFIILTLIMYSMNEGQTNSHYINFACLCISISLFIYFQKYTLDQTTIIFENIITKVRIRLADMIRKANLSNFDKVGTLRYRTLLTQETTNISNAAKMLTKMVTSATVVIIACIYIGYLSLPSLALIAIFISYGVFRYIDYINDYQGKAEKAIHKEQHFFNLMNHYFRGFKELKVDESKNTDLYNSYLEPNAEETQALKQEASEQLNKTIIFAQVFFYILIGVIIFLLPKLIFIDALTLVQIAIITLFITSGPLAELVNGLPFLERANMAIHRLESIEKELASQEIDEVFANEQSQPVAEFQSLKFEDTGFQYETTDENSSFKIGPVNFTVNRGEIVFIMGGNGSGKSTLLKVLTGLYCATDGEILWNSNSVGPANLLDYQSNFSVIFQDYHLFNRVYGQKEIDIDRVKQLLIEMHLQDKTRILEDGSITHTDLSSGQKKRLALVLAELEDREIFIFDEWAADQDPVFRKYFYEKYLKKLVQQGKTVIAVSHDDHYYDVADRIYQMDYGTLKKFESR
jgi:cyclic peptide transporter